MFDEIKKLLSKEYGINDLSPEMNFKTDLGLNSFDLMNLLCIAEEKFGIEIEEEEYRHLNTVGEMSTLLEKLTGQKR